ncbi:MULTISPECIES: DUF6084 family protein [unclassified Streptomyces]|uniref:DUF6084 family protein n=1 Tax=unclassified Streptomyces TaxID=2593676 RepID=UPI00224F5B91|nr:MULTISPECIES: DUF6084 family protein [unclassified Streptomyces]WSP59489.1 DUF6084 family protein [Streptomyces sp. NBC_01241]WSU19995.1 DUF6084 family protein [Streptomyces sp. NBC_01108]MCX4791267.1 DUF6084 family protein [Streptomyces sp. NBC_01221]MCX4793023.1 DUF6084 family protein [Streptomyces sp. NBC_01242]WSP60914.1 DUF6084 family protein [Streptomyces sp. NBC_01240]
MTDFTFTCTGVRADPYAAGPTLVFRLRITASEEARVHALALRCQIRIEPARRGYEQTEAEGLTDLFGERSRWGRTLQPVQFAQVPVMVPAFTGETETDVVVPCTYDLEIAATRYMNALTDGEVPLLMLFSGTAFTGTGGFRVEPVPWDLEAPFRMPVVVWQEMVDQHFPGCGWIRLPRDTMDALLEFRSRHALPSWEATVRALLDAPGTMALPPDGRLADAGLAGLAERTAQ